MKIPNGHQAVMPYLMINGAASFIAFTQQVFGATISFNKTRENSSLIMHSEIQISGSTIMFCDATEDWKPQTANMFVYVENADDTYAKALTNGATIVMPPADQDYGRSCGVLDPTGNTWWITAVK